MNIDRVFECKDVLYLVLKHEKTYTKPLWTRFRKWINGNLDITLGYNIWKHRTNLYYNAGTVCGLVEKGQWDMLEYIQRTQPNLLKQKIPLGNGTILTENVRIMDIAIRSGCDLKRVQWIHDRFPSACTEHAMDHAAGRDLRIVKWLHTHRTEGCSTWAFTIAFESHQWNTLRWLNDHYSHVFQQNAVFTSSDDVLALLDFFNRQKV